jgi:hypothetical protein
MDEFDETSKEPVDYISLDGVQGAVEILNNLSSIMCELEHYACVFVNIADILRLKKIRNQTLLRQDIPTAPELIERTNEDRTAFETRLDAF